MIKNDKIAYLSNNNNYTIFKFGDEIIRFRAPKNLVCYNKINKWQNGLLTVVATYKVDNQKKDEEECIDIKDIFRRLDYDYDKELQNINQVEVLYE